MSCKRCSRAQSEPAVPVICTEPLQSRVRHTRSLSTCYGRRNPPPKPCRRCGRRTLAPTSPEDYTLSGRNTAVHTATSSSNKYAKCHQDYNINVDAGNNCDNNEYVNLQDRQRLPPTDQIRTMHPCPPGGSSCQDTCLLNSNQLQSEHTAIPATASNHTVDPRMPSTALKLNLRYCIMTNTRCSTPDRRRDSSTRFPIFSIRT